MFNKVSDTLKTGTGPAHTLISRTTEVVGDIHFSGELIIEGRVKGNIYAEDDSQAIIRVAEKGEVEGEICVPSAVVNGLVQGDVRSATHLELASKAVLVGNVYYNLIEMVMGSEVNGNLIHIGVTQPESKRLNAALREVNDLSRNHMEDEDD
ncbi:MAG: polymer-forming cytoskeletal protein [Gammaproteobacteria bacterium]|nr:polymer-forming cytoskeletal protein [Gammaproteobacteria bacterium]